jgi:hypothetical protein
MDVPTGLRTWRGVFDRMIMGDPSPAFRPPNKSSIPVSVLPEKQRIDWWSSTPERTQTKTKINRKVGRQKPYC